MSRNRFPKEWRRILSLDWKPVYEAPLHGVHNSLFAEPQGMIILPLDSLSLMKCLCAFLIALF